MSASLPAISLILPFYNAAATLAECLASIAGQDLRDYEVLAINDGSTDASAAMVQRAAERDARIRLLQPGRVGLVAALNAGLAAARAPLLARMDADDRMHPARLRLQFEYLQQHPTIGVLGCCVELFPAEQIRAGYAEYLRWQNQCLTPAQIANNIYVESPFAHPSVMIRRSLFEQYGPYAAGPFPEDYELWLRLHAACIGMAKLPEVLLAWREHPGRSSRVDPRYARSAFDELRARYLRADPRLQSGRPLVIWGAGRKTRLRTRHLLEAGLQVQAWIDIDPHKIGQRVWGRPVYAASWLAQQRERPFVLVYVSSHGARELIDAELQRMDYQPGRDYLGVG